MAHLGQFLLDQPVQCCGGERAVGFGEHRGHQRRLDAGHAQQAQQKERAGGRPVDRVAAARERLVADRETGPDGETVERESVHPEAFVGEAVGQVARGDVGTAGQPGAGDAQREREPFAQLDDAPRVDAVGGQSRRQLAEKRRGVRRREFRQAQVQVGVEGREHLPAGDDDRGRLAARQHGGDLDGVRRVVEHQQDPPGRRLRAEPRRRVGPRDAHLRGRYAQRAQGTVEHLVGGPRAQSRRGAEQVDVDLTVDEVRGHPVCGHDGEGGLADATTSGQAHHRRASPAGPGHGERRDHRRALIHPAGERGHGRR